MARAKATMTVFSAAPVLRVFYKNLTIYLASSFEASYRSLTIIPSLIPAESLPDVLAMRRNSLKT